jgi:DNA polymerase-3 subunit beta
MRDLRGISMLAEGQKVLVAAKGLAEVQRLAGDGEIEIVLGEREVAFRTSRAEVTARLIEGEFPNYEQLIPSGYPNRLTVAKDAFRDAVERVMIVGQGRDNASVRLAMGPSGLELSMLAQDVGSSTGSVEAKFEGTELAVAFNPQFLLEGIDAIEGAEVALETVDPLKPATLRSADGGDFMYLLMPVRTS